MKVLVSVTRGDPFIMSLSIAAVMGFPMDANTLCDKAATVSDTTNLYTHSFTDSKHEIAPSQGETTASCL